MKSKNNEIGFVFKPSDEERERFFKELTDYVEKHKSTFNYKTINTSGIYEPTSGTISVTTDDNYKIEWPSSHSVSWTVKELEKHYKGSYIGSQSVLERFKTIKDTEGLDFSNSFVCIARAEKETCIMPRGTILFEFLGDVINQLEEIVVDYSEYSPFIIFGELNDEVYRLTYENILQPIIYGSIYKSKEPLIAVRWDLVF